MPAISVPSRKSVLFLPALLAPFLNMFVQTPGGNSGDIGCASGGSSSVLVLTIT